MVNNPVGLYLAADEVFPSAPKDFEAFCSALKSLSLTDTLFWCARINLILSNARDPRHVEKQVYIVRQFCTRASAERIGSFMQEHGPERVLVFFRAQLLELFRWACIRCEDLPGDGNTFNNAATLETFCRASLMASDVWARRIKLKERFDLHAGVDAARERSLDTVRRNFEATTEGLDPIKALGRAYAVFCEHLPVSRVGIEDEFLGAFGLSLDAYIACSAAIVVQFLHITPESVQGNPPNQGIFHLEESLRGAKPTFAQAFTAYLSLESLSVQGFQKEICGDKPPMKEDDAGPYSYNIFRKHPILRTSDQRAIVIDPVLFTEKILAGPLFHLLGAKKADANSLFDAYGRAFERYTLALLSDMFRNHNPNPLALAPCGHDEQGQPVEIADAMLRYGATSFLFEFKAVWIREDKLLTDDVSNYPNHLRAKYGGDAEAESAKGVAQLANSITKLASGKWIPEAKKIRRHSTFYPILLVHDHLIATPLHSSFLASEFKRLLVFDSIRPDGIMTKGELRVAQLIVMSIQDLEDLETSTRDFSLREFLLDYARDCADRIVSVHNYMGTSRKYKDRLRHSRYVASYSEKALNGMGRLISGESI